LEAAWYRITESWRPKTVARPVFERFGTERPDFFAAQELLFRIIRWMTCRPANPSDLPMSGTGGHLNVFGPSLGETGAAPPIGMLFWQSLEPANSIHPAKPSWAVEG